MTSAAEVDIRCPKCGKRFAVPLAEMAPGNSKLCPNCGTTMSFSGQDASKIQGIIDQIGEQIPGVRINVAVKAKNKRPWWKFWSES